MNVSVVDNCSFNGLRYSVQPDFIPTREQMRLKRFVEDKFNDKFFDYSIIENLENIAGADIFITVGQDRGDDVVFLDVRRQKNSKPLTKLEESFYDSIDSPAKETLIAKAANSNINVGKIDNFYKNCKRFVKSILESGEY